MSKRTLSISLGLALALVACNDDGTRPPTSLSDAQPAALEDALLFTTRSADAKFGTLMLDLRDDGAKIERGELPEGEPHAFARPAHSGEALILTAGAPARLEDGKGHDAVPSHLLLWTREGEAKRFVLSGSYSALALSEDGRYAIAHQPGGPWSTADSIALVDLDRAPGDEPIVATTVRALDGQGPSAVAFAPRSNKRRLAVLVMSDAINVLDLENPQRKDKVLPLKLPNGMGSLRASKVLFADDHCFVQADRGSDIFSVSFEDTADGFRATLSTFATASAVSDIELLAPEPDGSQRLLVLGDGSLRLIDVKSGKGENSSTGKPFKAVELFRGTTPFDDVARPRALLYAEGTNQVGFLDLQAELVGSERTVEVLTLSGAVSKLALVESAGLAIALQSDQRVSLIDISERTVSSLSTGAPTEDLILDQAAGVSRAWVRTTAGSLGSIDLDSRSASEVLLTHSANWVVRVGGQSERLVVGHSSASGSLTVLDARRATRAGAREVDGFLYSQYLD